MKDVPSEILGRQLRPFKKVDPAYGEGLANRLEIPLERLG